jgi:tellurite resistance protein
MIRFRPFAELFFLVAAADGKVEDSERAVILGSFRALTGGRVRAKALLALENRLRADLDQGDRLARLEDVCSALSGDPQDAELALTLASAVAIADKTVDPNEVELIQTLASWLGVSKARTSELLHGPEDQA